MNFQQFGVPISAALPIATQYQGGKITQNVTAPNGQVVGLLQGGENGVHYLRPFDLNSFTSTQPSTSNGQQAQTLITLPITMPGAKPGDPQQTVQIQVINPQPMSPPSPNAQQKFHMTQIPIQTFGQGATVLTVAYNGNQEGIQIVDGQNGIPEGMTVVAAIQPQDIQLIQADPNEKKDGMLPVALIKSEVNKDDNSPQDGGAQVAFPAQYLQNTTNIQEYLQKMQQSSALPLSLQQFLKFNTPGIKQEQITEDGVLDQVSISTEVDSEHQLVLANQVEYMEQQEENQDDPDKNKKKKKYKKKPAKPKKPKPGQVHIATALDGTTLFCCPECHMAYPDKELLETHLVGHKIERRFICDICGAGLKRKEHLERHKLGHNPERPFVCSVCMKGFKRKEHLNLHFVIHSGEKTEICDECGKGFYRKDHLRKHQRSHITRRAKEQAERQNLLAKEGTAQVTIQALHPQQEIPQESNKSLNENQKLNDQEPIQYQTQEFMVPYLNFQMPTQQLQIPVQIQVPQHHIHMATQQDEENGQVSTVVLPASEALSILPN